MKITGYTDFNDEHSDAIGESAFRSMLSLIAVAGLCALILCIYGKETRACLIALIVLVLEGVCNYRPLSEAYKMKSVPLERRESAVSKMKRRILISTSASIILLLLLTWALLQRSLSVRALKMMSVQERFNRR